MPSSAGLNNGDKVIVSGTQLLMNGMPIMPLPPGPPPAGPPGAAVECACGTPRNQIRIRDELRGHPWLTSSFTARFSPLFARSSSSSPERVVIPSLPISLYPQLAPPQVLVTTGYIGANSSQVESAVTVPLEEAINGVPGMRYIQSTSGNDGSSIITTTFNTGYDLDIAAVDVQNRVTPATGLLPAEVNQTGITVSKAATNFVFGAGIYCEHGEYSNLFMSNYLDVYVKDALKRVKGVGDVTIFGVGKYAMRIWLDPVKLAARQLTASDVVAALQEQNVEVPSGQLGAPPSDQKQAFQISVNVVGRLSTPEQFNNIVVKNTPAGIVQIKDVGHAELGSETYCQHPHLQRHSRRRLRRAAAQQCQRPAGRSRCQSRDGSPGSSSFPPGMKYAVAFDTTTIVGASIREVIKTLIEAIIIVILVIFFFLQDWRATLIPAVTIPVSLIGTFAFISLFGFSINSLTLFGITLATGLVVDDAIVVIENVQRHISEGDNEPHHATSAAMGEVTSAVIATSLVLIAVFVPVSFFPGTTGILYRQFSLTIAFSIAISAFNALTLSPALAALLLRREDDKHGLLHAAERGIKALGRGYASAIHGVLRIRWVMIAALLCWPLRRVLGIQPRSHCLRAAGRPGLPHDARSGAAGRFAGLHHPH